MALRIISGNLKGRRVRTVSGKTIRPTSDRLREAIFNILPRNLVGLQVLDLFAGTGALGIEALSRGARSAVFVDRSKTACELINQNLCHCGVREAARVFRWDILKNLNCLHNVCDGFQLVLMDPPYNRRALRPALNHLERAGVLSDDAIIVVEHASEEILDLSGLSLSLTDERRYGKTLVSFLRCVV